MRTPGPPLRDIHLPPPPSWWPPAPGWWLLAVLALALLIGLTWWLRRQRRRRRLWGAIRAELDRLACAEAAACAAGVSQLMRRVARLAGPAEPAASGGDWCAMVRRFAPDARVIETLEPLARVMYTRTPDIDREAVLRAAQRWLRSALVQGGRHA